MDRNYIIKVTRNTPAASLSARRAWIEIAWVQEFPKLYQSLSARRAWIEIRQLPRHLLMYLSLSARRAWIEIIGLTYDGLIASVALRKESVDRNYAANAVDQILPGRSPQGERG